jgi:CBS domain-containing protein
VSPRAACRLEQLGFADVRDYEAGKADWRAHGLPTEGARAGQPRVKDRLRHDVVTAAPRDLVGAVASRVARSPYRFALVLADDGTLLGRLGDDVLAADPDAPADTVMEPGPSTIRADVAPTKAAERMDRRHLAAIPVTTPQGRLLGVVRRDDVQPGPGGDPGDGQGR